jgi:hypothetical protein
MPASTSVTAVRLSSISLFSIFYDGMAFIGFLLSQRLRAVCPPHDEGEAALLQRIVTITRQE